MSSNTAAIDQYNQSGIVRILVIPRARARDLEVSPVLLVLALGGRAGHGREGHGGNVGACAGKRKPRAVTCMKRRAEGRDLSPKLPALKKRSKCGGPR